jgi:hypothetical protein
MQIRRTHGLTCLLGVLHTQLMAPNTPVTWPQASERCTVQPALQNCWPGPRSDLAQKLV